MRKIESLLKKQGKTRYQLANAIGESHPRTKYFVQKSNFSETYQILKKTADFLDVEVEDLID
jgi:transcriptional regulator with XRE-family HTH domain